MKLILLSGLDGTGKLFAPFIASLPKTIKTQCIVYPTDTVLSYDELITLVMEQLPKEENFTLLAESFSGYIAYKIALQKPKNLTSVIFVATFLENPRSFLSQFIPIMPVKFMLSLPLPSFVAKHFLLGDDALVEPLQQTLKEVPSVILYARLLEISKLLTVTEKVNLNTLYIQASNDILVSSKSYEVFERLFLNIERVEVKGSHLILQGKPKDTARVVERFMSKIYHQCCC